jgi:hypothetical protein
MTLATPPREPFPKENMTDEQRDILHDVMMSAAFIAKKFGADHEEFVDIADASIDCVLTDWPNKPVACPEL